MMPKKTIFSFIIFYLLHFIQSANDGDYSQNLQSLLNQKGLTLLDHPNFQCSFQNYQEISLAQNQIQHEQTYQCQMQETQITAIISKIENGLEKLVLISKDKNKLPIDFDVDKLEQQNLLDSLIPAFDDFFGTPFFFDKEHILYSEIGFQLGKKNQEEYEYTLSFRYNCSRRQEVKESVFQHLSNNCQDFENLQQKYNEFLQNKNQLQESMKKNFNVIYQSKIANKEIQKQIRQSMSLQMNLRALNFCIKNENYVLDTLDYMNKIRKSDLLII